MKILGAFLMTFAIDESFFLDFVNQIENYKIAYDFLSKISGNRGGGDRDTLKKAD